MDAMTIKKMDVFGDFEPTNQDTTFDASLLRMMTENEDDYHALYGEYHSFDDDHPRMLRTLFQSTRTQRTPPPSSRLCSPRLDLRSGRIE